MFHPNFLRYQNDRELADVLDDAAHLVKKGYHATVALTYAAAVAVSNDYFFVAPSTDTEIKERRHTTAVIGFSIAVGLLCVSSGLSIAAACVDMRRVERETAQNPRPS